MQTLTVSRSEATALELQCFARGILNLAGCGGHHHHQHLLVDVNRCYSVGHVFLSARKWQKARQLNTHGYVLLPFLVGRSTHIDRFKTRDPDQTPLRPQLLQSGNDLFHSSLWDILPSLAPIFITFGGPQAHGALR